MLYPTRAGLTAEQVSRAVHLLSIPVDAGSVLVSPSGAVVPLCAQEDS